QEAGCSYRSGDLCEGAGRLVSPAGATKDGLELIGKPAEDHRQGPGVPSRRRLVRAGPIPNHAVCGCAVTDVLGADAARLAVSRHSRWVEHRKEVVQIPFDLVRPSHAHRRDTDLSLKGASRHSDASLSPFARIGLNSMAAP